MSIAGYFVHYFLIAFLLVFALSLWRAGRR